MIPLTFNFRGKDFRPDYLTSPQLRSIFQAPTLGLSATINEKILADIKDLLKLGNDQVSLFSAEVSSNYVKLFTVMLLMN